MYNIGRFQVGSIGILIENIHFIDSLKRNGFLMVSRPNLSYLFISAIYIYYRDQIRSWII